VFCYIFNYYIFVVKKSFPAGGGRRVIVTMCTKWYSPTVRMLFYQVLQGWPRFSPRFSELDQRCNLWGRRFVIICRVDNCCFGQSMSPIVGSLLLLK